MIVDPHHLDTKRGRIRSLAHAFKRSVVRWALSDVPITNLKAGENTITLSPGGVDVLRWSSTIAPVAAGDLGMNVTSGRPSAFVGAASEALALQSEVMLLDGTQPMTGDLSLGSNEITNVAEPTAASSAATRLYVDTRIAPQVDIGASGAGYLGTGTIADIDALTPAAGDAVVAEDAGTPAAGSSDALAVGDLAEYDGTNWLIIVANSGGFPPSGTRALVATSSTFVTGGGLTASTDEGKLVRWDGTALDRVGASDLSPSDGSIVSVRGEGAVNENRTFTFDGSVPTGLWTQSGGVGADHGALTGLTDDDHSQYALLAGRGASQTLNGGANAGGDLILESTSNVTKGDVQVATGSNLILNGNDDIVPATDNTGEVGTASLRFASVRAVVVTSGDLNLEREAEADEGGGFIAWTIREYHDGLRAMNRNTGEEFDLLLRRRDGIRSSLRRALGI